MTYTIADFHKDFPSEDACLTYILRREHKGVLYRVKGRKCFEDTKGRQIYPLKGTIFEKSSTPLLKWFYVIFLFSTSKNGLSAMEIQRQIGVTYKCAWRMGKQIRSLMKQPTRKLKGIVEADETYVGGRRRSNRWYKPKTMVVGAVERNGQARVKVINGKSEYDILPFMEKTVQKGSKLMTDQAPVYRILRGYHHQTVCHSRYEWARGEVYTNTIEGFWSQLKRSLSGTYHAVSKKHLQSYVDQFVFQYNHRASPFSSLLELLC